MVWKRGWAQNRCTEGGVDPIRQLITDSFMKYDCQVLRNTLVETHWCTLRTGTSNSETGQVRIRDKQMEAGSTSGSLWQDPCHSIAKWPWIQQDCDGCHPSPSSRVPSITRGKNLVLCICPLWAPNSLPDACEETFVARRRHGRSDQNFTDQDQG